MPPDAATGTIELRLRDVAQLFPAFDPSPFPGNALAPEAEEYIVGKAKDLAKDQPIRIIIHLPPDGTGQSSAADVSAAIATHFADRSRAEAALIREHFRTGRRALLVGLLVLSICLFIAWHITQNLPARPATRIFQESFVILGWVSVWKPVETFLYDWMPLTRRRDLFRQLSKAVVTVRNDGAP